MLPQSVISKCRLQTETETENLDCLSSFLVYYVTTCHLKTYFAVFRGHSSPTLVLLWNIPASFLHIVCLWQSGQATGYLFAAYLIWQLKGPLCCRIRRKRTIHVQWLCYLTCPWCHIACYFLSTTVVWPIGVARDNTNSSSPQYQSDSAESATTRTYWSSGVTAGRN